MGKAPERQGTGTGTGSGQGQRVGCQIVSRARLSARNSLVPMPQTPSQAHQRTSAAAPPPNTTTSKNGSRSHSASAAVASAARRAVQHQGSARGKGVHDRQRRPARPPWRGCHAGHARVVEPAGRHGVAGPLGKKTGSAGQNDGSPQRHGALLARGLRRAPQTSAGAACRRPGHGPASPRRRQRRRPAKWAGPAAPAAPPAPWPRHTPVPAPRVRRWRRRGQITPGTRPPPPRPAPAARVAQRIAQHRAQQREQIPQQEHADPGRPAAPLLVGCALARCGGGRFVNRQVRGQPLAPAGGRQHAVHLHAIDRVAHAQQRRRAHSRSRDRRRPAADATRRTASRR